MAFGFPQNIIGHNKLLLLLAIFVNCRDDTAATAPLFASLPLSDTIIARTERRFCETFRLIRGLFDPFGKDVRVILEQIGQLLRQSFGNSGLRRYLQRLATQSAGRAEQVSKANIWPKNIIRNGCNNNHCASASRSDRPEPLAPALIFAEHCAYPRSQRAKSRPFAVSERRRV